MASKRRLRRKTCGNKQAFNTQAEAVAFLISFQRRKDQNAASYKCAFCHKWHIGHYCSANNGFRHMEMKDMYR